MPEPFDKTDDVLSRKLAEIAPPADLRARLLAIEEKGSLVEARTHSGTLLIGGILAAAAALVCSLFLLGEWAHRGDQLSAATADMSAFLSGNFALAMETPNVEKVKEWLAARWSKGTVDVPGHLADHPAMGCRELEWRGHKGMLACFRMKDGKEAHLVMFPSKTFSDAPGTEPQVASAGAWTRAAWSKGGLTYMLFVPTGMDPMKMLTASWRDQVWEMSASRSWKSSPFAVRKVASFAASRSSDV